MSVRSQIDEMLRAYKADHTHPLNRASHLIGIPMIIVSLPLIFFVPPVGIALFVIGWAFQLIGHAIEGKAPSFFRDPRFLLVGATWFATKVFGIRPTETAEV